MLDINYNILLSKKTSFFLIYFYTLVNKYIFGYLTKLNRLYLFIKPVNLLLILTFQFNHKKLYNYGNCHIKRQ